MLPGIHHAQERQRQELIARDDHSGNALKFQEYARRGRSHVRDYMGGAMESLTHICNGLVGVRIGKGGHDTSIYVYLVGRVQRSGWFPNHMYQAKVLFTTNNQVLHSKYDQVHILHHGF